ncbi:hypothetical protein BH10CYA1_BH10CYA1_61330 [soil metagenome]
MNFFPIIALCDKHNEELKELVKKMPDELETTLQERVVRAACDVNYEDQHNESCEVAKHWYYLRVELTGWRMKEAGTKGGAAKTDAKAAAARANGAKGGRPVKQQNVVCYQCKRPVQGAEICAECRERCPICGASSERCQNPSSSILLLQSKSYNEIMAKHRAKGHELAWFKLLDRMNEEAQKLD